MEKAAYADSRSGRNGYGRKEQSEMAEKIGFIGAGNMAGAIVEGILKKSVARAADLAVCNRTPEKCARFAQRGVRVMKSAAEVADSCGVIFLAVKPQNYDEVLAEIASHVDGSKILVSIAAGISSGYIKQRIGFDCKVVRAMPNTPLLLGEGATALCQCPPVSDAEFKRVADIFAAGGEVAVLPEDKMNAVIAVNGSSPAYAYLFAKAVIDGAVRQGIDAVTAKKLICRTLVGSAAMLMESGMEPDELIRMVSSPGGTTLKAMEALYEHGFEEAIIDAMARCTQRAEELGR